MSSALPHLRELTEVSPEIGWKLVDQLFAPNSAQIIGPAIFILLGMMGFIGTGSRWYLAGSILAASNGAFRLWQSRVYARRRDTAPMLRWARRNVLSGWMTAAGWGAWSAVMLWEPNQTIVLMVVGVQLACLIGSAVRNCSVRVAVRGQVFLTLTPMALACLASPNIYLKLAAGLVCAHMFTALSLANFMHQQTLRLLRQDQEKSELLSRLETANRHLETLASTDALTGVANRRHFDLEVTREWRRCMRDHAPLSLLLIDVDKFKAFNDLYGHQAGDECLKTVAATAQQVLRRSSDLLARHGGEEFVVILPETGLPGAGRVAENIRRAIAAQALTHAGSVLGHVTVSIGAACVVPSPEGSIAQLTAVTDAALYEAKRTGRNRVHAVDVTPPAPITTDCLTR